MTINFPQKLNVSWRTIKKSQTTSDRTLLQDCSLFYGTAVNHYCNTKCKTCHLVCSVPTSNVSMTASAVWLQTLQSISRI